MDVRAARIAAGFTQADLAQRAAVRQPNLSAYENGRRTPSPVVLERIRRALARRPSERLADRRDDIRDLVDQHHASDPRLIGSVARGEDREGSDLDLVVTFNPGASLFDEIALRLDLEELLGVRVDVISSDSGSSAMRRAIDSDAVPL